MKKTDVSEKGLEDIIADHLVAVNGYALGKSDDFDAKFAVDWPKLHGFLLKTQPASPRSPTQRYRLTAKGVEHGMSDASLPEIGQN